MSPIAAWTCFGLSVAGFLCLLFARHRAAIACFVVALGVGIGQQLPE
jgi:hypothetical protein